MKFDPESHHRQSIRMVGYDYTSEGAYFVTICVKDRDTILGRIENDAMILSDYGTIVRAVWLDLPRHYSNVVLDEYVIMPNHFHGILFLSTEGNSTVGAGYKPAQDSLSDQKTPPGLSEIVRNFKTFSARHINRMRETPGVAFWQRNYFERIIRDDDELNRIRQYILDNPQNWQTDEENPGRNL